MGKRFSTLLNVQLYELTAKEIGKLRIDQYKNNRFYETRLPKYCIHSENGTVRDSDYYLQFVETGDEKFILFNANTVDEVLQEEISAIGLEEIFKDIDLRPYIKELHIQTYKDLLHSKLQVGQYLVINIDYVECGTWEYKEWEAQYSVCGVLRKNLTLIESVTT
jgi:hypothetical protein